MRKKIFCLMLLVGLLLSGTMTVFATDGTDTGADNGSGDNSAGGWYVTYTADGKMSQNLGGEEMDKALSEMQPGDEITVRVALTNNNSTNTYWYMRNNVINSMEKTKAGAETEAKGGAYNYKLTYYPPVGDPVVLYTSEKVGGENSQGLMDLETDERLKDHFYLGNLTNGQSGRVELTVGLDGETQGNSYQGQAANLAMNFAVEPQPQGSGGGGGGGKTHHRTITREIVNNEVVYLDEDGVPLARNTDIVKTSDEMKLYPYILAACISGSLLLILAFFGFADRKREEKEGGAAK